jgi:hypothetical protein
VTTIGRWNLLTAVKLVLLLALVAAGASALVRDARPAHASHTAFHLSYSSSCLTIDPQIFAFVGGPPQDIYLCVKNVDNDPYGAAAFNLEAKYVSWLINVNAVNIETQAAGTWLGTTGRAVQCLPVTIDPNMETGQGRVYGGCQTPGTPPPYGPTGNAVVAKITIQPGIVKASTYLDFRGVVGQPTTGTHLVSAYFDAQSPFGSVLIPAAVSSIQVFVAPCADYVPGSGDNYVAILDIYHLAQKFGRNINSPPPPTWNPDWDMDGNNAVTIQDILLGAKQFGRSCPGT